MLHITEGNGVSIKNEDWFNFLKPLSPFKPTSKKCKDLLFCHTLEVIGVSDLTKKDKTKLMITISSFCISALRNWTKSGRSFDKFSRQNKEWLEKLVLTSGQTSAIPSLSGRIPRGRPKKAFSEVCDKTKRRRLINEVQTRSEEELCLAAEMKLHSLGKRKAASEIHNISSCSDSVPEEKSPKKFIYSPKEALSLFIELKLTTHQYRLLRSSAVSKNLTDLFPPYYLLSEEKSKCYPKNVEWTDVSAEVPLQDLVDHTVARITEDQEDVLRSFKDQSPDTELEMVYKWGADGSGSQQNYKQTFELEDSDDSNIFVTSLVPLRLESKNDKRKIIWQNSRTNSTRLCRPIRLQFIKETYDTIISEFAHVDTQINNIVPTKIELDEVTFNVHHKLFKTMVDGKICNAVTSTKSTQKCYICKASSAEFNKMLDSEPPTYDPSTLDFGISSLHAYLRFFECLLHISYKLPLKTWQARGKENKKIVAERKKNIQQKFKKIGLLVDIPKPGFGNTNDGNTARFFFNHPEKSSEITEIDVNLISRFAIIVKTLSCPYKINGVLFNNYAKDTAKLYVQLYGWYPMPPSVHKVLIHGKDIIEHFLIPIGQLGEDAQECRHKDIRYYREHNTRKMSRKQTNEDLFKILLMSSDPQISSLRPLPSKTSNGFPQDVIQLLDTPNFENEKHN